EFEEGAGEGGDVADVSGEAGHFDVFDGDHWLHRGGAVVVEVVGLVVVGDAGGVYGAGAAGGDDLDAVVEVAGEAGHIVEVVAGSQGEDAEWPGGGVVGGGGNQPVYHL